MNFFKQIVVHNFRNYKHAEVSFDSYPVVLYGKNGSGKTNLMEAFSLFAVGTGFRGAKLQELAYTEAHDECESKPEESPKHLEAPLPASPSTASSPSAAVSPWAITATLNDETILATGYQGARRICKIQGAPVKSAAKFHDYASIIHITPDMDHIFTNASSERRRFVDRLIESYDPTHMEALSIYEKATHQRLTLLKKSQNPDLMWLDSLEKIMAQQNIKIAKSRTKLTQRLMDGQKDHVPLFPQFLCKIIGRVEDELNKIDNGLITNLNGNINTIETVFRDILHKNRETDRLTGMTTFGCHRSDFDVTHKTKNRCAKECSTGEQKILLISTILSFVHQKIQTLDGFLMLLLDDVIARLDHAHRMVLFEQVEQLNKGSANTAHVQTFFSGTDIDPFNPMKSAQFFEINRAEITQKR
ncbi:MAG: AAA family ATPase [Holosporales bacterium]|jgi:DNA replication and repair protein RecF|nr:AAA family ATPase [Holosporales bacterium]